MTTLATRFAKLAERKYDPSLRRSVFLSDSAVGSFQKLAKALPSNSDDAISYISECAEPLDDEYTQRILNGANAVKRTLVSKNIDAEYEFQGSVTNNTHIKIHSDIDLLVITNTYVALEHPLAPEPGNEWTGNPVEHLIGLRANCEKHLLENFSDSINSYGAKSIGVHNAQLACKVDVVPANWMDTKRYRETNKKIYRGIQVLDKKTRKRLKNFPFLHNHLLDVKDNEYAGALRRLIRLLKSIRSDSEPPIEVTSYDIVALCYNMPDAHWPTDLGDDLALLSAFLKFTGMLIIQDSLRDSLKVPNGTRKVFGENCLDVNNLATLYLQMRELVDLTHTGRRSLTG